MNFTSFNFLLFFPVLICLYYITPGKIRWIVLLLGSLFFYANTKPVFLLLVSGIALITWFFSGLVSRSGKDSIRKRNLWFGIILVLLPLIFFKYYIPINEFIIHKLEHNSIRFLLPEIRFVLPVGISFYTFMAIGYLIDVYMEDTVHEKNPAIILLFLSFFPIILSGPIERSRNMLFQFRDSNPINYLNITKGLKLLIWGYFLKLMVADRLGIYIDAIYGNIIQHNGTSLLAASILYPFQVYADLAGYSLIAIGVSRAMGIRVMDNFRRPFFATSMAEFWRRWHISLISWLTDYVYTPLSFSFRTYGKWGIVLALMVTFFLSGIWHGAALTYVVWGIMQGFFLSIEALTKNSVSVLEKKYNLSNRVWYILICILFTFILFTSSQVFAKSPDIKSAITVYEKIFTAPGPLYIDKTTLVYALFGLFIVLLKDFVEEFLPGKILLFENKSMIIRYSSYIAVLLIILLTGVFDNSQFIYFQF